MTNRKYTGVYVYNRASSKSVNGRRNNHQEKPEDEMIVIEGGCPMIVPKETFNRVQERMKQHKHKGGKENAKQNYLLSGKVRCMDCGR